jgi:hypothetical protein
MAQTIIDQEVTKIGITNNNGNYWYFYALLLDGKPCAKFGMTGDHLGNRIYKYLEKEHSGQTKDWSTFHLICAIKFKKKSCIKHVEGLVKVHAKDHPLHSYQHFNTEQYNLPKVWEQIREFIMTKSFPFAEKVYLVGNPDEVIQMIVSCAKPIIPVNKVTVPKGKEVVVDKSSKKMTEDTIVLWYINQIPDYKVIEGIRNKLGPRLREAKPFKSLESIAKVDGIGKVKYNAIINYARTRALYAYLAQS